jgi:hypothetical protein
MQQQNTIGKLQRVPLRTVWPHEAYDFTTWLEENIDTLNECLGLDLQEAEREQAAGSFSVDLVARDQTSNRTAIIENQFTKSDHDHLGKLLTYLTLMRAEIAVWIVPEARPEHTAVITWLNSSSSADFYMVKAEAVQIGNSAPAPLFTLIAGPSAEIKEAGHTQREYAERHDLRQQWWTTLLERANKVSRLHSRIKIAPTGNYLFAASGISGLSFVYIVYQNKSAVELLISRGKDRDAENINILNKFRAYESEIERGFGYPLVWETLEGRSMCKIRYYLYEGGYQSPQEEWPSIQDKIIKAMNRLEQTLKPYLSRLNLTAEETP